MWCPEFAFILWTQFKERIKGVKVLPSPHPYPTPQNIMLSVCKECARKSDGFWNLKNSLPATRRFHTDSHRAQCCLEFSWDRNVSICVNKLFHFCLKMLFHFRKFGDFWRTCTSISNIPLAYLMRLWNANDVTGIRTISLQTTVTVMSLQCKYLCLYHWTSVLMTLFHSLWTY
jgi:hypothetical protein